MSDEMGTFRTEVQVSTVSNRDQRIVMSGVLVDTGAELSWFPARVLESLGIERLTEQRFRQASGTIITRWTGPAMVYAGGRLTADDVVFGEPDDLVILGARSLEGLNLRVDTRLKQLVDGGPAPAAVAA